METLPFAPFWDYYFIHCVRCKINSKLEGHPRRVVIIALYLSSLSTK